jgi:hypothetical protein
MHQSDDQPIGTSRQLANRKREILAVQHPPHFTGAQCQLNNLVEIMSFFERKLCTLLFQMFNIETLKA